MPNILHLLVRIHLTGGWRLDPSLATAGPAAARRALEALSGVLTIEVDGVDLTGGRAEGPVLAALEGLLGAVARLQAGEGAALASLRDGDLLLLLRRRGSQALLSLVELGPPARLPVRDLAVELASLTAAALEAASSLCRALASTPPAGALAARRLRGASRRRPRAELAPTRPAGTASTARVAEGQPASPASSLRCEVRLDDDDWAGPGPGAGQPGLADLLWPGRVTLATGGPGPPLVVAGFPYLTLRDLVAGLAEVARAEHRGDSRCDLKLGQAGRAADQTLRFDLRARTLALPGSPPAPAHPVELGEAVRHAVERLAALAAAGHPARAENPLLLDLRAAAGAAVAHLAEEALGDLHVGPAPAPDPATGASASQQPLSPGALRHVAVRVGWQEHVGAPVGPGLAQSGGVLLATGREAVLGRCGARTWRAPGADWAALAAGLLLLRRGDRLLALEPGSGRERWSRPLPEAHPTGAAGRRGEVLLLGEAGALSGLDPRTGATHWRLELPGGHGLALAAFGPLVAAGTGSGLLYGVDLAGRIAWRLRAPGPALAPPLLLGRALASLHAAGPGASLVLLEPETGRRLREVPLDVLPAGPPLRFAGGLALAGRSGGTAVVTLVRPATGRAWTVEAPLAGTPRLAVAGRALLASDAAGALARLEPSGRVAWSLPPSGSAGGAAPAAARGVVAAARDGVTLVDLETGRILGAVAGLLPARLLAAGALSVTALEADGTVTGLTAAAHLSLLRGAPPAS